MGGRGSRSTKLKRSLRVSPGWECKGGKERRELPNPEEAGKKRGKSVRFPRRQEEEREGRTPSSLRVKESFLSMSKIPKIKGPEPHSFYCLNSEKKKRGRRKDCRISRVNGGRRQWSSFALGKLGVCLCTGDGKSKRHFTNDLKRGKNPQDKGENGKKREYTSPLRSS